MPQPSAELKLLLREIATGNSNELVRRKLRDMKLQRQLRLTCSCCTNRGS